MSRAKAVSLLTLMLTKARHDCAPYSGRNFSVGYANDLPFFRMRGETVTRGEFERTLENFHNERPEAAERMRQVLHKEVLSDAI